jgi:type II secretory pathway pseudopilin PulG
MIELLIVIAIIAIMAGVFLTRKTNEGAIEVQAATRTVANQLRELQNDAVNGKIVNGKNIYKAEMFLDNTTLPGKYYIRYYDASGSQILSDPFTPVKSNLQTSGTISFQVPTGQVTIALGGAKGVSLISTSDPTQKMAICVNDAGNITETKGDIASCGTATPTCTDGIQNQGETGIDCGGPCAACAATPTCTDGIQNQGETGIDCGGPCAACAATPTCTDGIQNQGETGIDCGGPCAACAAPTCTSWTYSAWGDCQADNTQTRTILTSSPSGCTGGSPVITQSCTSPWLSGPCLASNSIYVYATDLGSPYTWGPNSSCATPQCATGIDPNPNYSGRNTLVADNSVDFSSYPARNACKAIGGRLPTVTELQCIFMNRASYGNNFANTNIYYYWSSVESSGGSAYCVGFRCGVGYPYKPKHSANPIRCVK